jgi:hypothetical protein
MSQETLSLKIALSGTYWDKKPQYRILFNDQVLKEAEIASASDEPETMTFSVDYTTDEATLAIELVNKTYQDTVQNEDQTAIVKDMLLNIVGIEIDDINLGQVPFQKGQYHTAEPVVFNGVTTQVVENCVNLGWNGSWRLTWTNPFYIWLLENQ